MLQDLIAVISGRRDQVPFSMSIGLLVFEGEASVQARTISTREKAGAIQYGYRKCGTNARVFSQTLAHGNSRNEIRNRYRGRIREEKCKCNMGREKDVPTAEL